MSPAASRMPALGDVLLEKFRLESVIGEGGMGRVYRARQVSNGNIQVAIKVLSAEASTQPDAVPRFLNEAHATQRLQSEHVVKVIEGGTLEALGLPFLIMELLEGSDLAALIERRGSLPIAEAVDYVIQACDAIAEAHRNGIIHRDLKPSNLFLTVGAGIGGTKNIIKVLDFGISKVNDGIQKSMALTSTGAFLGSPHYMSPEQLKNAKDVDARADIWSLGVILYELIAGKPPFDGGAYGELFLKVMSAEYVPLSTIRPKIPPVLEQIIASCLKKARDERFPDIARVAQALAPFASPDGAARAKKIIGAAGGVPASAPAVAPPAAQSDRHLLASTMLMQPSSHASQPHMMAQQQRPPQHPSQNQMMAVQHPSQNQMMAQQRHPSQNQMPAQHPSQNQMPAQHPSQNQQRPSHNQMPAQQYPSQSMPAQQQHQQHHHASQPLPSLPQSSIATFQTPPVVPKSNLLLVVVIGAIVFAILGTVLIVFALRARSGAAGVNDAPSSGVPSAAVTAVTTASSPAAVPSSSAAASEEPAASASVAPSASAPIAQAPTQATTPPPLPTPALPSLPKPATPGILDKRK